MWRPLHLLLSVSLKHQATAWLGTPHIAVTGNIYVEMWPPSLATGFALQAFPGLQGIPGAGSQAVLMSTFPLSVLWNIFFKLSLPLILFPHFSSFFPPPPTFPTNIPLKQPSWEVQIISFFWKERRSGGQWEGAGYEYRFSVVVSLRHSDLWWSCWDANDCQSQEPKGNSTSLIILLGGF